MSPTLLFLLFVYFTHARHIEHEIKVRKMTCDITGSKQIDWILDVGLGVFCVVLTADFILVVRFIISGRCRCWTAVVILLTYCTA